jgi:hypothetical protein
VLHELREFCEDNNVSPPGPLVQVPARPELNYWSVSDPALDIEAAPAVRISAGNRSAFLQRVVYELRYLLLEGEEEFERGDIVGGDVAKLLEIARAWLGGADTFQALPPGRRPLL